MITQEWSVTLLEDSVSLQVIIFFFLCKWMNPTSYWKCSNCGGEEISRADELGSVYCWGEKDLTVQWSSISDIAKNIFKNIRNNIQFCSFMFVFQSIVLFHYFSSRTNEKVPTVSFKIKQKRIIFHIPQCFIFKSLTDWFTSIRIWNKSMEHRNQKSLPIQ